MCFSEQTLSAYLDNELVETKGSEIYAHLKACSSCSRRVDSLRAVINRLKESETGAEKFIKENVWTRLSHSTSTRKRLGFWYRVFILPPSIMVSLSLVFLIVIGASLLIILPERNSFSWPGEFKGSIFHHEDFPVEISVNNIENILAYFNINDDPVELIIKLPDASNFSIQGEPLFLLKADFISGR